MRISDWSSDVCSSDLGHLYVQIILVAPEPARAAIFDGLTEHGGRCSCALLGCILIGLHSHAAAEEVGLLGDVARGEDDGIAGTALRVDYDPIADDPAGIRCQFDGRDDPDKIGKAN